MEDRILESMDRKKLTALVLLIGFVQGKNLRGLGLSNEAVEWFKSYLSGRSQVVRIGSTLSESLSVTHGVPQGSILGPILFNIDINELPLIPTTGSLESFFDDSKLFACFPIKNINVVAAQLTEDLRKIAAWCCTNSLLINPEETKLLLLGTRQMLNKVPDSFGLAIFGKQLYPSPFARDLGVTIDASLNT